MNTLGTHRVAARRSMLGVTLLELMAVVMVIGILGMIAIPSYRQYVMRAQRAEAKTALLQLQTNQERFYLANRTYGTVGRSSIAANLLSADARSERGHVHAHDRRCPNANDATRPRRRRSPARAYRHDDRRPVHVVLDHGAGRSHGHGHHRGHLLVATLLLGSRPVELEQVVENDQRRADRDRGVGDVERREVVLFVVHANEVDHVAEQHAVDDVAERTAENQR